MPLFMDNHTLDLIQDQEQRNRLFKIYAHDDKLGEKPFDDFEQHEKLINILGIEDNFEKIYEIDVDYIKAGDKKINITSKTKRKLILGNRNNFSIVDVDERGGMYRLDKKYIRVRIFFIVWKETFDFKFFWNSLIVFKINTD